MKYLFVSDLHLDGSAPRAIDAFLALLAGEARESDALYILGDLFESWIGDDDPDPARTRICEALQALTQAGVAIFVMRGNRDFLLGEGFAQRTGASLLPDPVVAHLGERRVLLSHGDIFCTGDHAYQELRTQVNDAKFRERLLALSLESRQVLAAAARAGSKAHTAQMQAFIMDVAPEAVTAALRVTGTLELVHGHTHRPGEHRHEIAGRTATRRVLDAWYEHGEVLALSAAGWQRRRIDFPS